MATYQIDSEKQTILSGSGHNYAWTNVYLIDTSSLSRAWDWAEQIASHEREALPVITSVRYVQARPGVGGPAPETPLLLGYAGSLAYAGSSLGLFDTARLEAWADSRRLVWYKRWRGPMRPEDRTGDMLSASYRLVLVDLLDWLMGYVPMVTRSGRRPTTWAVNPLVYQWQMRDGSTRRVRSVIAP